MMRRIFHRLFHVSTCLARRGLLVVFTLWLSLCGARAETTVRSSLSAKNVSAGEILEFEIVASGDERAQAPTMPSVDGLEIGYAGGGQRSTMLFGGSNSSFRHEQTFTFQIVPKREGQFTIPALEMRVGNRVVKTLPATFTVAPGETMQEAGSLAFAKISLGKKSLYVGEVAPLEVRLYLDASARWDLRSMPTLSGDGFTTRPFEKPSQRRVQLDGKTYDLATFSTLITPGRAGKIAVGPVPTNLVVSKPERGQQRLDIFGRSLGPAQEVTVAAPPLEIEVKPLPVAGRPKDFSGAIGKFEFEATGAPARVKVGEPVTMKLTIRGSGNFDRIAQPPLAEPDGWTTYSAKQEFQGGERAGTEGVKTFELPVTPTARKTTMPVFAFSYFDPEAEKYVTLKSSAAPLTVEGAPVIATAAAEAAGKNAAPPKDEPKAPATQGIVANLPDLGAANAAFGPSLSPAILFSVLFAPVPLALALVVWRRKRGDGKMSRLAALRRERAGLLARLKNADDCAAVFDAAVKVMQLDERIATDGAAGDDAGALLASRKLDAETENALRGIFDARSELLYAGAARGADRIGGSERDRVLDAVAEFERSPRR